jgi:trimeric autotransporter adhesin
LNVPALVSLLLLLATTLCGGQQVSLLGLRSLNHAGAFHSLKQDAAGNLYTLFDAHDGVRILKLSADGTQVLAQTQLGQAGDAGIALALDSAGSIYVAGTSTSLGSITGTSGTAFPNRRTAPQTPSSRAFLLHSRCSGLAL